MTRPHHHPVRDSRGFASVEHEHPGAERPHTHEGQPELGRSLPGDELPRIAREAAARAGVRIAGKP
jgi:hypothetical protein